MDAKIRHWLAAVSRASGLGEGAFDVASDAEIGAAWDLVGAATGTSPEELCRRVADHFRLNVADLRAADPQAHKLVPAGLARRLCILPLSYTDRSLVVATADPVSLEAERELAGVTDRSVVYRVAPPQAIREAIERTYAWADEDGPPHPPLPQVERRGPHVLVVDDDEDTRLLLRTVLEAHGYRVSEADDGVVALELLEEGEEVELMTLDLWMDEMDGVEVLRKVRSREATRGLPIVVATGADDPEVEIQLFEEGADDFIVKPLDPRRFLLRVEAVLRRRGVEAPDPRGEG